MFPKFHAHSPHSRLPSAPRRAFHRRVSKLGDLAKYWLPVCALMAAIFIASTELGSSHRTSRIIGPFLRWLKPDIADETVSQIQYGIRKCGHVTEFGLLAFTFWRARRRPVRDDPRPWDWNEAVIAIGFAAAYAVSDEMHQAFVPSRDASIVDELYEIGIAHV